MTPTALPPTAPANLLRASDILERGQFSKTHLYAMVQRGQFPRPALRCGPRFTRWSAADVDAWFADPAGWMASAEAAKAEAPALINGGAAQ